MISDPIIQPLINGYRFLWSHGDEWEVVAKITKIVDHPRSGLFGELTIEHEFKDKPTISGVRINLTSQQARNTIAKRLNDAKIINLDWATLIDQICAETIVRAREGEPVEEIWTSEDVSPPEYLLEPILIKGIPTIIFGEKAVAKSTLSLIISTCLLLPWYDNPLELIAPKQSVKTLILDYEAESDTVHWNMKKLQEGMNLPHLPIYYRRCILPLADDIEEIQNQINNHKIEVLIIDSLGAAAGGDLKDAQTAMRFFSALRKLRVTSLIIAQTSKDKENKNKTTYGSSFFDYYARSVFELRKSQSESGDEISIGLFHKYCNLGKLQAPIGFRISFNNQGTQVEREDVRNVSEFLQTMGTQTRVYQLLKDGALSVKEIAETLDLTEPNIRMVLSRLGKKGKVTKIDGEYGLCV